MQRIIKLPLISLTSILDKYCPSGQQIDFLSVDCEGLDLDVLQSNNFTKYRPKFIIVEIAFASLEEMLTSKIAIFLAKHSYNIVDKCANSVIFKDILI